jgi:hypothetical protein
MPTTPPTTPTPTTTATAETGTLYKCPECREQNSCFSNMLSHVALAHHQSLLKKAMSPNERSCQICSDAFPSKLDLVRHLVNVHKIVEKFLPPKSEMEVPVPLDKPLKKEPKFK